MAITKEVTEDYGSFVYTKEDYVCDILAGKWRQTAIKDSKIVHITVPYADARANKNTLYTFKKILGNRLASR